MIFTTDTIKTRQHWALDHPARTVNDFYGPGYVKDFNWHGLYVRTVLSIDLFQQPIAWRAEVALMYPGWQPRPLKLYSMNELILCHTIAKSLLEGVGLQHTRFVSKTNVSIELANNCTPEEAVYAVNAAMRPAVELLPVAVGEINEYDLSPQTQIAGVWDGKKGKELGFYQPSQRRIVYVQPGTETSN